ncbi:MAG: sulfatase-like hydrolase/transferase, partial [Opitutae bacterium]|nr:sulfatase-like hydrolase/transferase [Opitutae bacterium]
MKGTILAIFVVLCLSAQSKVKNVLLIVSDDLKADALGCYGNKIAQTPHVDQLAKEGTLFRNAYCQGTTCRPSRASFMRGRRQGERGITWGEHFRKNGFSSTRVGKIFHMRVPGDIIAGTDGADVPACWSAKFNMPGKEAHTPGNYACLNLNKFTTKPAGRQSTRMPYRMFVTVDYVGDGSDQPDWKSATKSIELLKSFRKDDKPFFLATGLVRPHYPNVAPEQYFARYPYKKMTLPFVPSDDWDDMPKSAVSRSNSKYYGIDKFPDNQRRMWAGYLATVTFMDEQVGRILKTLRELELDRETAVFFTSDHGYLLGEHHFWQKGNLREEVTRVPLIMKVPTSQPGSSSSIVELIDLFPTACEATGLTIPKGVEGKSLFPVLENPK